MASMIWRPWPMQMWVWLWGRQRPQLQPPSVTHTTPLQVSCSPYTLYALPYFFCIPFFCIPVFYIPFVCVPFFCIPFFCTPFFCTPFFCTYFVCDYVFCASVLCTAGPLASAMQGCFSSSPELWCMSSHTLPISRCDKNALAADPTP